MLYSFFLVVRSEFFKNNVTLVEKGMNSQSKRSTATKNSDNNKLSPNFTIKPLNGSSPYPIDISHAEIGVSAEDMGKY